MAREGVISGYYGIFRPPYSILNPTVGGTVYCITSQYRNVLVLIPLVPNFFVDVVKIIKRFPSRDIRFIVPDIGPRFISDYISSWYYIKKKLGFSCRLFSKYLPEGNLSEEFLSDIDRNIGQSISFVIARDYVDVATINAQVTKMMVNTSAPWACDVIIKDTNGRKLFVSEMNMQKAEYLNGIKDAYDEIHMPFIEGTYPSMTYNEVMRNFPGLVNQIVVNQFASKDELDNALNRRVQIGRLVSGAL